MGTKAHSKIIEQTSGQMVKALKKYYIEQKKKKHSERGTDKNEQNPERKYQN